MHSYKISILQVIKNYLPVACGLCLVLLATTILYLLAGPISTIEKIYEIGFIAIIYFIGAFLIWINIYAYSKRNKPLLVILLLAVPVFLTIFNRVTPTYEKFKLEFTPGFEGKFCVVGGVKNAPSLLQSRDNILFASIPDSGILYTSGNFYIVDEKQQDLTIYIESYTLYSLDCKGYSLISGYKLMDHSIKVDTVYDAFFERDKAVYTYDDQKFDADFKLESYVQKKYKKDFDLFDKLSTLCDKELLGRKYIAFNLKHLYREYRILIILLYIDLFFILVLLPPYFSWNSKKNGKRIALIYLSLLIVMSLLGLFAFFTMGWAGIFLASLLLSIAIFGGLIFLIISLISWVRYKRNLLI